MGLLGITAETLSALYNTFSTIFNATFSGVKTFWEKVAMHVPSGSGEVTYAWLGAMPKMREWLGDRILEQLKGHEYSIKNKDWEATIEVARNDIEDDNVGVYNPMFGMLGESAAKHPDELIFELLGNAFSTVCYDGQNFIDTDHPVGEGVVSNSGGGAGVAWFLLCTSMALKPLIFQQRKPVQFTAMDKPEDESVFMRKKYRYGVDGRDNVGFGLWQMAFGSKATLDKAAYAAARQAMMAFKNDVAQPLGIIPNLLVVPPSLEDEGLEILNSERDAAGATNVYKGTAELLVVPYLS